jgi:hypothetical protein
MRSVRDVPPHGRELRALTSQKWILGEQSPTIPEPPPGEADTVAGCPGGTRRPYRRFASFSNSTDSAPLVIAARCIAARWITARWATAWW